MMQNEVWNPYVLLRYGEMYTYFYSAGDSWRLKVTSPQTKSATDREAPASPSGFQERCEGRGAAALPQRRKPSHWKHQAQQTLLTLLMDRCNWEGWQTLHTGIYSYPNHPFDKLLQEKRSIHLACWQKDSRWCHLHGGQSLPARIPGNKCSEFYKFPTALPEANVAIWSPRGGPVHFPGVP